MFNAIARVRKKTMTHYNLKDSFRNEDGAIDLASIMVGIMVIGLIGGVIAATTFSVIPWSQDNAAKQQLESIHTAQNAYFGINADPSQILTAGQTSNTFTDSAGLDNADLLTTDDSYCVVPLSGGKDYQAYSKSGSGTVFTASNSNKKAVPVVAPITDGCSALSPANLAPIATPGYQIIKTYDYEKGLSGWAANTGYGSGAAVTGVGGGYNGTKGMITSNSSGYSAGVFQNTQTVFQTGKKYKLTAWVKVNINSQYTDLRVANSFGISSGGSVKRISATTNGQWQKLTYDFTGIGNSLLYVSEASPVGVPVTLTMDDTVIEEKLP